MRPGDALVRWRVSMCPRPVWTHRPTVARALLPMTRIAALLGWLANAGLVVCEPTGGYEEPLVQSLRRAGIPVHLAHPNRVRAFAQASGQWAKTDLDAQALFGEVFASVGVLTREGGGSVPAARRHPAHLEPGRPRLHPAAYLAGPGDWPWTGSGGSIRADCSIPGVGELTAATLVATCRNWAGARARDCAPWWDWRPGPGTAGGSGDTGRCAADVAVCAGPTWRPCPDPQPGRTGPLFCESEADGVAL